MNFFFENLSLLPETRQVMEHFKLVFGSGNSDLAKIRPLKVWTSWISPFVPPYGILPPLHLATYYRLQQNSKFAKIADRRATSAAYVPRVRRGQNLNDGIAIGDS